jgi:signal transduction histidine kinase/CheY-like chemotaxis protein
MEWPGAWRTPPRSCNEFIFKRIRAVRVDLPVQCIPSRGGNGLEKQFGEGRAIGGECVKVWGKQHRPETTRRGVARAAAAGAARQELVTEATHMLLASGDVDRAGVWIEANENGGSDSQGLASFRGIVCDLGGEATPAEWARLSAEAPLPPELLVGGKTVEQELYHSPERPVIGPLVEMRRALWVPIENRGQLRGMAFAGTRRKQAILPRTLLESVAAELGLAMELEEERRLARERHADLGITRAFLAALATSQSTDAILADLVESCTETGAPGGGLGAIFAVIAQLRSKPEAGRGRAILDLGHLTDEGPGAHRRYQEGNEALQFSWWSGDAEWTRAVESEPLAGIWQRALEAHRVIGSEPGVSWSRGEVARVVAIPLEADGETLGVLVAGLRHGSVSLALLERLELRAALATSVLLRRKQKEAVKHQATWQQALLQNSREALVLLDAGGDIAGLSPNARELLGQQESDSRGEDIGVSGSGHFLALFCARERQRMQEWLRQTPAAGSKAKKDVEESPAEVELCNGERVRVWRMARSEGGAVGAMLEPLPVERSLSRPDHAAEAQLFTLIEWLEEGVVLFDANHGIRAMNSRFAQIAGLSAGEMCRITTLNGLIAHLAGQAADPQSFAQHWRELALGGDSGVREEIHLLRPVPRLLERAARPVLDASERRIGRVEIYRDLTAQRVFQSKLLQTEKLAALGQMIAGVAHELSNPLTSVLGYAQRLLLRNDASGQSEEARQIFQEAERANTILRQLLMTVRESRPGRDKVALNQVVSRTMELQRFSLAAEKILVELDLDPHLPFVQGDAGQLQQVLMNLMGNARQAVEQQGSGGIIRLSTRRIGERYAVLEICDNGPGIPDTILARIFDPFFTTKPPGIGTGLGLSIVLGIVREHGGQVKVASPSTGGAIFTLEFPAIPAEESRSLAVPATGPGGRRRELLPERRSLVVRPPSATRVAPTGGRVLVVEDEPTVARLIGDVLEDEGFRVDLLLDGREALKRAASENYDLVICDMKMPGLDGQHFYKRLARTGNPLRDRFLFVTGDVIATNTHEFLARNHLPHVAKPFRIEELTEKVRLVLANTKAGGRAGGANHCSEELR